MKIIKTMGIETAKEMIVYLLSYLDFIIFLIRRSRPYQDPIRKGINKMMKSIVISI